MGIATWFRTVLGGKKSTSTDSASPLSSSSLDTPAPLPLSDEASLITAPDSVSQVEEVVSVSSPSSEAEVAPSFLDVPQEEIVVMAEAPVVEEEVISSPAEEVLPIDETPVEVVEVIQIIDASPDSDIPQEEVIVVIEAHVAEEAVVLSPVEEALLIDDAPAEVVEAVQIIDVSPDSDAPQSVDEATSETPISAESLPTTAAPPEEPDTATETPAQ